jgi:hypothetical protein
MLLQSEGVGCEATQKRGVTGAGRRFVSFVRLQRARVGASEKSEIRGERWQPI